MIEASCFLHTASSHCPGFAQLLTRAPAAAPCTVKDELIIAGDQLKCRCGWRQGSGRLQREKFSPSHNSQCHCSPLPGL